MTTSIDNYSKISGLLEPLAQEVGMDVQTYHECVYNMIFGSMLNKGELVTASHVYQLAALCRKYGVNPFLNQVYAVAKGGVIRFSLTVDGWLQVLLSHSEYESHEYVYADKTVKTLIDGHQTPEWVQMVINFKDGRKFAGLREYYMENRNNMDSWQKLPTRMTSIRATCQAVRFGLSIAGFYDDEPENNGTKSSAAALAAAAPAAIVVEDSALVVEDAAPVVVDSEPVVEELAPATVDEAVTDVKPVPVTYDYTQEWNQYIAEQTAIHGELATLAATAFENFLSTKQSQISCFNEKQWAMAQRFVQETIQSTKAALEAEVVEEIIEAEVIDLIVEPIVEHDDSVIEVVDAVSVEIEPQSSVVDVDAMSDEATNDEFDFTVISNGTRQAIQKASNLAIRQGNVMGLTKLRAFFQNDVEIAYLNKIIAETARKIGTNQK
ncbi:recombinase RecT [Shewanella sp. JNE4-2]|uniref:recombinase RecT n=1 Tax=Shewanella sp. JNE4-2 TaxID=2983532 RepID=UPI002006508D|nr:recombinase RecT [Shewanella sp. JNE4-2]MCK7657718.1 recombinase RecT [Shewanella sp. JNE4-2]